MRLGLDVIAARLLRNRRLVRAPIWLYQHRAGWLFGTRILMVEHVGRKSGTLRYVCLEVVERPRPTTVVVVSGFGERAQWYLNLRAHPECFVTLGRHRLPARARIMPEAAASAVLSRYQAAHPRAWKQLRSTIEHLSGRPADHLPMVELLLGEPGVDATDRAG